MVAEGNMVQQKLNFGKSWIDGCFVNKISRSELVSLVNEWIEKGYKNKYITAINMNKFMMIKRDKKLADFVINSPINIADGFPIYLGMRLIGDPIPERITGADLMESLFELANDRAYSVYFFGSKLQVLNAVIDKCRERYPNLKIAGSRDGYFTKDEELSVVRDIAAAEPDILLVALGVPQKEYFVDNYGSFLKSSVILPVGGAFDVYAGEKKRAPLWVQRLGVEWLWRSLYDRSRAKLVYTSLVPFFLILMGEIFRQRILRRKRD